MNRIKSWGLRMLHTLSQKVTLYHSLFIGFAVAIFQLILGLVESWKYHYDTPLLIGFVTFLFILGVFFNLLGHSIQHRTAIELARHVKMLEDVVYEKT